MLVHAEFAGRILPGWIEAEHDPKQATHNAKLYPSRTLGTLHSWPLWTLMFPTLRQHLTDLEGVDYFQQLAKAAAEGMVGIDNIDNAVVRIFWAWISDAATEGGWTLVAMFRLRVAPTHSGRRCSTVCASPAALTVSGLQAITVVMFLSVLLAALVSLP